MRTSWLTYRALARALRGRLAGCRIASCYTQDRDELIVELAREGGTLALRFSARPHAPGLQATELAARARSNTASLFPELEGAAIRSVDLAAADRMIRLALDGDRALVFFFHATRANAGVLLGGTAVALFKQRRELPLEGVAWDGLDLPLLPAEDAFRAALAGAPTLAAALRRLRPWLTGPLAEEIRLRACVAADADPAALDAARAGALYAAASELLAECDAGQAIVISSPDGPEQLLLYRPARIDEGRSARALPLLEALELLYRGTRRTEHLASLRSALHRAIDRETYRLLMRLDRARPEEETVRHAAELERCGELLLANLASVASGLQSVELPDIFLDDAPPRVIALAPELTAQQNAARYFARARALRASIERTRERISRAREQLEELEAFRPRVDAAATAQELRAALRTAPNLLKRLGMEPSGTQSAPFPFRRFHVAGGFEVWVGKDSAGNDALTLRHSKPDDLWFHARGVGGSHTVLKVASAPGEPGRDSIREAAAIAAWYSKYRKAKHIPVVYTERKYVRKPKGVPAGTVVLLREKVVMVDPKLPEGEDDDA